MGLKLHDFECAKCEEQWEELVDNDNPVDTCPACGTECQPEHFLTPTALKSYSMMDAQGKDDCLKKRSVKHTQEEIIDKEPEKWGNLSINLHRSGRIQSAGGMDTAKTVGKKKAAKGGK